MSSWNYQKVQGDEINVKNYIIDLYFELNTKYGNYVAYNKQNNSNKIIIFSGIVSLYNILKNYKAVRNFKNKERKQKFDNFFNLINNNGVLETAEDLRFCVEVLGEFMFMAGFTDINWEFKDFEKSL